MATPGAETILITVDIKANNERLVELTKQLNENRAALKALADANKAGTLTSDELAAGQVRLKQAAAAIGQETRLLTKANQAQEAANKASTGSIEQLRAQLATGTTAYNALSAAERDNTAAGQQLQATNRATSDQLKVLEGAIGDTRRNVGNYAGSIGPLIQELVKLQEQQKKIPEGTAAYQQAQAKVIGFQQAVNDAGVKAGLTYDQTQAKIAGYGGAIAPVTAKLVQLEAEQKKAGEGSKEYAKIGFQIGAVKKELDKIPESAAKTSDSIKSGFQSAVDKGLAPFKTQVEQSTGLLGKFKSGSDLVKDGLGMLKGAGETGSLGFKAIAGGIALTGIGLFVIAISAVVLYFTQTAEGGKILSQVLGGLGAVVQVVTDLATGFGKAVVFAVTHPLEAIKNLGAALTNALLHPIDTARGLGTAIGNLSTRIGDAAKAGAALVAEQKALVVARRELEIEDVKEQSRVSVLLRLSKERGKSATEQLAALKEAGRIEAELTEKNIKLQQREAEAIRTAIKLKGAGKAADLKADLGAKEKEIAQTLASQNEVNAKIRVRESVFNEKRRADAKAAALQARQDEVRDRQARLETALLSVEKGSAAELAIKKKLIEAARDLELVAEKVTADQKKLIRANALVAIKALQDDFNLKAIEAAKKAAEQEAKVIAARATEVNREYAQAITALEDYLNAKRAAVERDYALGKIGENEYQKQLNAIEKAGNAAALVNAKDYGKDTGAIEKKTADTEIKERNRVKAEKKRIKDTEAQILEAGIQAAQASTDVLISFFGQETAAGQAALAVKKTLALAEIGINLQKQLSLNHTAARELDVLLPGSGIAYEIATDALAIASAAAGAAKIAGFKTGGYVSGPGSGTSDSIPARLSNGESVMNANTTAMFAPLLSHLNVLGGGVAFATGGLVPGSPARAVPIADGGFVARQMGGQAPQLDYPTLIKAIADYGNFEITGRAIEKVAQRRAAPRALSTLGG